MSRALVLILLGIIGLGVIPVHATTDSIASNLTTPTGALGLPLDNGPFSSHCSVGGNDCAVAIPFTVTSSFAGVFQLNKILVSLCKVNAGPPSGNLRADLLPVDGNGLPSSVTPIVSSNTMLITAVTSFTCDASAPFTFTFTSTTKMRASDRFAISIASLNTTNYAGGAYIGVVGDGTSCSGSTRASAYAANTWTQFNGACAWYQVYADTITGGGLTSGSYFNALFLAVLIPVAMLLKVEAKDHLPLKVTFGLGVVIFVLYLAGTALING